MVGGLVMSVEHMRSAMNSVTEMALIQWKVKAGGAGGGLGKILEKIG